jgi:hypothetical protein
MTAINAKMLKADVVWLQSPTTFPHRSLKRPAARVSTFIGQRDAHSNTLANKYLANFGNADNRPAV